MLGNFKQELDFTLGRWNPFLVFQASLWYFELRRRRIEDDEEDWVRGGEGEDEEEYEEEEKRMGKIIDLEGERRPRSKQKWILAEKTPLGILLSWWWWIMKLTWEKKSRRENFQVMMLMIMMRTFEKTSRKENFQGMRMCRNCLTEVWVRSRGRRERLSGWVFWWWSCCWWCYCRWW